MILSVFLMRRQGAARFALESSCIRFSNLFLQSCMPTLQQYFDTFFQGVARVYYPRKNVETSASLIMAISVC